MINDQKTVIGSVSVIFAQEESQDRKASKPRHVQDQEGGRAARAGSPVLQTPLGRPLIAKKNTLMARFDPEGLGMSLHVDDAGVPDR